MATRKPVNLCKAVAVLLAAQLLICVQCNERGGGGGATFDYVPRNSLSFSFVNASDDDEHSTAVGRSTLGSETNGHHSYSSSESTSKKNSNRNVDISRDTEIDKLSCGDGDFSTNGGNVSTCSRLPPLNGWNKTNPPPSFTLQNIPPRSSGFAPATVEDDKSSFSNNVISNISSTMNSCFEAGTWSTTSTADTTPITASVLPKNKLKTNGGHNNEISNLSDANTRNTLAAGEKEEAGILSPPPLPTSIPSPPSPPIYPPYINGTTEKDQKSPHSPYNLKRLLQQLEVSQK